MPKEEKTKVQKHRGVWESPRVWHNNTILGLVEFAAV